MVDARPCNVIDMLRRVRNRRTIIITIIIIIIIKLTVRPAQFSDASTAYRVGQKSKLLFSSEYASKTEKIGGM